MMTGITRLIATDALTMINCFTASEYESLVIIIKSIAISIHILFTTSRDTRG